MVTRLTCSGNCGAGTAEGAAGSPFCTIEPSTVLLALVLMTGIRSNRPALNVCVKVCILIKKERGERGSEGGGRESKEGERKREREKGRERESKPHFIVFAKDGGVLHCSLL